MIKGNVRKPVPVVDVERTLSLPKERELERINKVEMLKKRNREIEVPLEERKTFQSGYSRKFEKQSQIFFKWKAWTYCKKLFSKRSRNKS